MDYVVVAFGAAGGLCGVDPCPMDSYGPFSTLAQAYELAGRMYAWQQPHVLSLRPPDHAILAPAPEQTTDARSTDG